MLKQEKHTVCRKRTVDREFSIYFENVLRETIYRDTWEILLTEKIYSIYIRYIKKDTS